MKYDTQLTEAARILPGAKNILIVLPVEAGIDELAAGLSIYLSLKELQKEVSVVTEGVIKVGHAHLFGVGQIQNKLPEISGGDFVLVLGGVATSDGKVPAVEKMDYYPTGSDLNLVFRVMPGQKFNPTHITPKFEGGGFDLIFAIGAPSLESLGSLYSSNPQVFSDSHVVNISNKPGNMQFGKTNIVDPSASSVSEIVGQLLPPLSMPIDQDIATNLLAGIFAATANLQAGNATADTYEVVASVLRSGGQKPQITVTPVAANIPVAETPAAAPAQTQPEPAQTFDLNKVFGTNLTPADNFTVPPVVNESKNEQPAEAQPANDQPSAEEAPAGEGVSNSKPEADWLTPKIYKGSSIG